MGKVQEERAVSSTVVVSESAQHNAEIPCSAQRFLGLRCALALLLSAAVFISAVFWLPPFLGNADQGGLDLDSRFRDHDIVASFKVKKPVSFLEDSISQLVDDIFDEINPFAAKVIILSLEPSSEPNTTKVVFAIDPDPKYSGLSLTTQSLIRANFESLVIGQLQLRLSTRLFGLPFLFEVLKFPGGFTVSPLQSAFLLQKVQILFNFTLNFSIDEVKDNFDELMSQLKSGLHLSQYENLYVSLSNLKGSTVAPPTIIQSSVLLAIGNFPSTVRLKQLAQTIASSHARNLGLNHTVFGRVKQVRLSSILRHSLHGDQTNNPPVHAPAPAPAPATETHHHRRSRRHHHHHHWHHHHHRHHRHHFAGLTPVIAPAPFSGLHRPGKRLSSPVSSASPHGCHGTDKGEHHVVPPMISSHSAPSPQVSPVSYASHSPNVNLASGQPPSGSKDLAKPSGVRTAVPPLPSSSAAGVVSAPLWSFAALLALGLHV